MSTAANTRRLTPLGKRPATSAQTSAPLDNVLQLRVGQVVNHARFGRGTVQSLEDSGMDAKATILFDNGETRKLLLRFAKLT